MSDLTRDLMQAIRRASARCASAPIIAEIKARTPRSGELLRGRSVEALVGEYEAAGAIAISVVTGAWFGGTLSMLERAAGATQLPLLRKDLIPNRASLLQSRQRGASAVLITTRLHSPTALQDHIGYALELGLTPFVEVDDLDQLATLRLPEQTVVAINNSDIRSQERHTRGITRSLELLPHARATGAGALVAASAICTPQDAQQLRAAGFDALLIGSALLQARSAGAALRELQTVTS